MAWIVRIAKHAVFNLDAIWSIWAFHDEIRIGYLVGYLLLHYS